MKYGQENGEKYFAQNDNVFTYYNILIITIAVRISLSPRIENLLILFTYILHIYTYILY